MSKALVDSFSDGQLVFRLCTITTASPAVILRKLHGLEANDRVQFYSDGTLPTGLAADTWYFVITTGLTDDEFEVSTAKGSTAVNATVAGSGNYYFANDRPSRMSVYESSTR